MPTATLRLPVRSALVQHNPYPTHGVEVLASIRLDTLADALGRMEHDDIDPGERPMNADQCRDALLREMLLGWKLEDLVDVRIPVVNEAVGEIISLRRRLDAADRELDKFRPLEFLLKRDGTPAMGQAVEKIREQADEIATLRRERDEARASRFSGMLLETFDKRSSSYEELAEKINSWLYADRKPATPTPGAQA